MSVQAIDTAPITKLYGELNKTANDINKKIQDYNKNTAIKTALFFATSLAVGCAIGLAGIALAGIALPVSIWSTKTIAILTLSIVPAVAGSLVLKGLLNRALVKAQNVFLSKICADIIIMIKTPKNEVFPVQKAGHYVGEIQLPSYETYEKNYIAMQQAEDKVREEFVRQNSNRIVEEIRSKLETSQENIGSQEKQSRGLASFLPSFLGGAKA